MQLDQLTAENPQNVLGKVGEPGLLALDDPFREIDGPRDAPSNGNPELRGQAPEHVDQLGALPNHEIPCAMQGEKRLLVLGLDLDKAHRRSRHGFANGLCIDSIGLAPFHVGTLDANASTLAPLTSGAVFGYEIWETASARVFLTGELRVNRSLSFPT